MIYTRSQPTMEFIGVTTGQSSIMQLFPRWARVLGLPDAQIVGRDLPLEAPRALYQEAVEQFRRDPLSRGALVTTHKINLLQAARPLFDHLDPHAQLCGEVSCIVQRQGNVWGFAKDPLTSARALEAITPPGFFSQGGQVLMFGAGGAGMAILVALLERTDPPSTLVVTDPSAQRLDALQRLHHQLGSAVPLHTYPRVDHALHAELLAQLPPHSLVINASGLGKDRPGSPLPNLAHWPRHTVAWELNYRGSLEFLHQARAAAITIHDGWLYFLHGWSEAITEVFGLEWTPEVFAQLQEAAEQGR